MRARRITRTLTFPAALLLGGCGYVHLGKLPAPVNTVTVMGDDRLMKENSDLRAEKKILQQELALTRAQGDALRMTIENRAADGDTSKRLAEKLTATTRELAQLRATYATLQAERNQAVATAGEATRIQAQLGAAEEKLAASLRGYTELQGEIDRLKSEVQQARTENLALTEKVRTVTAENAQAQAALAQLNTDLLAQKDARARAEQDVETLRNRVPAGDGSALAQQRTGTATEARTLVAEQAAEIISLKTDLDALRAKVAVLDTERAELKQQLAATPAPDLQAKLDTVVHENTELRTARSELENQLARLKNAPAPGVTQAQALREQLREAQAAAVALTEENRQLKVRLASGNAASRNGAAESVTRINLDAPQTPKPAERVTIAANEVTPAPAETAPAPSTSSNAQRHNGQGVNATLVTSASGSRPAAVRPDAAQAVPQGRVHVVAGGDTLSKISAQYYGTPGRWADILAANRDILGENNNLVIGRTLRIP